MELYFESVIEILDLCDKLKPINDECINERKVWFTERNIHHFVKGNVIQVDLGFMDEQLKKDTIAFFEETGSKYQKKYDSILLNNKIL